MRPFRSILATITLVITCFVCTLHSSCSGKCGGSICMNGGECKKGECVCPNGYKGDLCEKQTDACGGKCLNGGECVNGTCDCDPGYEGEFCEMFSRVKFTRYWRSANNYYSFITSTNSAVQVKITNIANTFFIGEVDAYVDGNTLTIASQNPDNNNRTIAGSGTYDKNTNKITWHYTLFAAPDTTFELTDIWTPAP